MRRVHPRETPLWIGLWLVLFQALSDVSNWLAAPRPDALCAYLAWSLGGFPAVYALSIPLVAIGLRAQAQCGIARAKLVINAAVAQW
jgi:hypothetical protein